MQLSKAYLWLFTLVAASVPLLQLAAWWAARWLPARRVRGWMVAAARRSPLKRLGWSWGMVAATSFTIAFQLLALALVTAYFYYPDTDAGLPYWADYMPPGSTVSSADKCVCRVCVLCVQCADVASTERATARVMQQPLAARKMRHQPGPGLCWAGHLARVTPRQRRDPRSLCHLALPPSATWRPKAPCRTWR